MRYSIGLPKRLRYGVITDCRGGDPVGVLGSRVQTPHFLAMDIQMCTDPHFLAPCCYTWPVIPCISSMTLAAELRVHADFCTGT